MHGRLNNLGNNLRRKWKFLSSKLPNFSLMFLEKCCLYQKSCRKNKKTSMSIRRNQKWLNSYDFHFLVSMWKVQPVEVQENKNSSTNVQRKHCWWNSMIVSTKEKNSYSRNLPKKRLGITLSCNFVSQWINQ